MGNIEEAEADGLWRPIAETHVSKRVIACLDVRSNDEGDLVVTKGDQYDVRERAVRAFFFVVVWQPHVPQPTHPTDLT